MSARRRVGAAAVALLCAGLAACTGSAPPAAAPVSMHVAPAAPVVPPQAPKTTGVEMASTAERNRLVAQFGGAYAAPATERYLNHVLAQLAAANDTPSQVYRITILDTPMVNAFAMPTGDLYVTRGLLALANDTSELAAVMAHEIGHVIAGHAAQRAEQEKNGELFREVAARFQGPEKAEEVQTHTRLSLAGFSREQEFEADQIGVRTIGKAGYDPYGAARFLASLARSTELRASLFGQKSGDEQPDLMSTHPTTPERIARATSVARQIGAPGIGDRGRDGYLEAIDGLAFGDNPDDGLTLGRTFIHPKLGFSFQAPPGFVLDNSAQAVLGVAQGGAQALRLDTVRPPAGMSLLDYLKSGWIDGLDATSVESLTVNGLSAATAVAHGEAWSFRLAAIQIGDDVYRLIFASRTLSAAEDTDFRTAIASFKRLTPAEAAQAQPLRVKIVRAKPGDTASTLAIRMALSDRPLDNFLLLNGLQRGDSLQVGEAYKIVTH